MSISKLYLFSKNTDAPFAARGFEYQKMKTLETWLNNYLNKVDEVIYCDYEEDVFQRNDHTKEAKFRQIKLYKANFSFKSEEVQKAVAHFFMLHVNSAYQDWSQQFVFEANSGVAAPKGDNESALLREWVANQGELLPELLGRCTTKVKEFVTDYIEEQAEKLAKSEDPSTIAEARQVLQQLGESEWQTFTQCIRWEFEETATPEAAFAAAHTRVQELVAALPFNLPEVRQRALEGILWEVVSLKITGSQPAERALTLSELEHHILASGTEQEQWYLGVYEKWRAIEPTGELLLGELLEIITAANYCRWTTSLANHATLWLTWLKYHLDGPYAIPVLWRGAAYEYLFLQMRPIDAFTPPSGTIAGSESYARRYFENLDELRSPIDLENAQALLALLFSAYRLRRTGLTKQEVLGWLRQFQESVASALASAPTPSAHCRLLECQITSQLFAVRPHNVEAVLDALRPLSAELLRYLPDAAYYHVTHLSEKLVEYHTILRKAQQPAYRLLLRELDELGQQLEPYVQQRGGARRRAERLVKDAAELLQQGTPDGILEALNSLQGAKDLWNNKETTGSFVGALLLIASVYQSLGLSLASKYYALGAAWVCEHSDEGKLLVREPEALALVFQADFQQGAWLSATVSFETYLHRRIHLNPQEFNLIEEPVLQHAAANYSLLHFAAPHLASSLMPLLHKQLSSFTNYVRGLLVEPALTAYTKSVALPELPLLVGRQLVDHPLNDAGAQRTLAFQALGSTWTLIFANTYRLVPVAEEFAAYLQIVLAEIALTEVDFHLPKGHVELRLIETKKWGGPKRLPTNTRYAWEVGLRYFDKPDPAQIKRVNEHVLAVTATVLGEMSLLLPIESLTGFTSLFEKNSLYTKSLFVNAYQRMYRYFVPHKKFSVLRHARMQPSAALSTLRKEHAAIQWKNSLSAKYDPVRAEQHIRNRFENSTRCTWLTLGRLQQDPGYDEWLRELRQAGWPDWQILVAMGNYIINAKAHRRLAYRQFRTQDESVHALNTEMEALWKLDELECYVSFCLESFQSEEFREQLTLNALYVLRSYGLNEKGKTPHFEAIKEFLRVRFNGQQPGSNEGNPLLTHQVADLQLISEAIGKDWESAVSLRLTPSPEQSQPAVAVLTFTHATQGHSGYELLLDFYHWKHTVLLLSTNDDKLQVTLLDEPSGISIAVGQCRYDAAELARFITQHPADDSLVFAIGTEDSQGQGLIATRSPFSPFCVKSYRYT